MLRIVTITLLATMSVAQASTTAPTRTQAVQAAFNGGTMAVFIAQRTRAAKFRTKVLAHQKRHRTELRRTAAGD